MKPTLQDFEKWCERAKGEFTTIDQFENETKFNGEGVITVRNMNDNWNQHSGDDWEKNNRQFSIPELAFEYAQSLGFNVRVILPDAEIVFDRRQKNERRY